MSAASAHSSHLGPVLLIVVFGVILLLAIAVLARPQFEWKILRGRLANPEISEPTRAWRAVIRSIAFVVAVVSIVFLILGISRL